MWNLPIWLSTVIFGFGTVFVGLIALIWIVKLMSFLVRRAEGRPTPGSRESEDEKNRTEAVITAAVAVTLNMRPDQFRIVSIQKRTGE